MVAFKIGERHIPTEWLPIVYITVSFGNHMLFCPYNKTFHVMTKTLHLSSLSPTMYFKQQLAVEIATEY